MDFNLFLRDTQAKGAIYPTTFHTKEVYQFPLIGQVHFLFVVSGEVRVEERNQAEVLLLRPRDTLIVTRLDQNEYVNLNAFAPTEGAQLLWGVVHLADPGTAAP